MKAAKYVSEFLSSKDVKRPVKVTIVSAELRAFDDEEKGKRTSLVIFFKELDQGVVLCKASARQLIDILQSDETDTWIGKQVVLYNDEAVTFKGRAVGGLRFKAVA